MKSFEIEVSHNGTVYRLQVEPHPQEPEFSILYEGVLLGVVRNDCDERGDYWCSSDTMSAELVEKIGERIEKYER